MLSVVLQILESVSVSILLFLLYRQRIVHAQSSTSRLFARTYGVTLIATNGPTKSLIMPRRAECVSFCGRDNNCCCTQWNNSTNNCTIAITDYFTLVPNGGPNNNVGVDGMKWLLIYLSSYQLSMTSILLAGLIVIK